MRDKSKQLQAILDKLVDHKKVFGTSFAIKHKDEIWQGAAGNIAIDQPYFIASTTKLFVTAIILNLKSKGKLRLTDKISNYLNADIMRGLHVLKGVDHADQLTINHLLSHTSGIPDYFQKKGPNGKSLEDEITAGNDQDWTFEQAIARSKKMPASFVPGKKGKAHYSDTNFQLLGKIIENITQQSFASNCLVMICTPLELTQTYVYHDASDQSPTPLYYKSETLHIPKAMASFGADGGVVSTSGEMLTFIEGFFAGKLFPQDYIEGLMKWNRIFFPLSSGVGIHKVKLPWIFNPSGAVPELFGHSGLSGALAFYGASKNIYISGTVNQVAHPEISFRTMIRLIQKAL